MIKNKYILNRYQRMYDAMHQILLNGHASTSNIDSEIARIEILARFAWNFHPGFFVDASLEKRIAQIGALLPDDIGYKVKTAPTLGKALNVTHIATQVYSTGGHTRLLLNIIKRDKESVHSLILVKQDTEPVPTWLTDAVVQSGGSITILTEASAEEKAIRIRTLIRSSTSLVLLHIHPDDAAALVAIATVKRPPVIFINHADHVFALGTTLTEVVACFRVWSLEFTLQRRGARKVVLLPTPLDFSQHNIPVKTEARKAINVTDAEIMLLSVASAYKFIPDDNYNFFQLLKEVIDCYPNVVAKIIGVAESDAEKVGYIKSDRIELVGKVENPVNYYVAADIYVDSLPLSSITSLWEGIYFGSYPALAYNPISKLNHQAEPAVNYAVLHSQSKIEWLQNISNAIEHVDYREKIANQCAENVRDAHAGIGWDIYLRKMYANALESKVDVGNADFARQPLSQDDFDSAMHCKLVNEKGDNYLINILYGGIKYLGFVDLMYLLKLAYNAQLHGGFFAFAKHYLVLIKNKMMA